MEPIYTQNFEISDNCVDCFGNLKLSSLLYFVQEVAGRHVDLIFLDYEKLSQKGMFWAVIRQKVQITRLPRRGETIRVETWPMPPTRVAFPRSVVAYDESGSEVFRSISIWVLMDSDSRSMILPSRSGIALPGTLRGNELTAPASLSPKCMKNRAERTVCFTDLDRNAHMNNTRYMEWIDDLLPSAFHHTNSPKEFTVCYLSECREGQALDLRWDFIEDDVLQVDAHRTRNDTDERVFSAQIAYDPVVL